MKKLTFKQKKTLELKYDQPIIQKLLQIPKSIIFIAFIISVIGFIMMFSAANGDINPWASKQITHFLISLILFMIISVINVRFYYRISYYFYFFSLILLVIVELFGYTAMGATRWFDLGFLKIQPSDFMKISIILALARYYHDLPFAKVGKIKSLIIPIFIIFTPIILILKQPDLGTAMLILFLSGGILFVAGVKIWKFVSIIIVVISATPIIWNYLHDYQKNRIMIFLNPELDPLGAGYNITQSKIAIGSGGLTGKGLMNGSQSQLNFLPERHTDFIFTMFAEEWGFFGALLLILLYSYLTYRGGIIAINCKHHFGRMMAMGAVLLLFIHVFVNMAMVMGLLPVVGIPLPLMSYGGTIMLSIYSALGLISNAYIHKKINLSKVVKTII